MCSIVETNLSRLVSGLLSFEHPSVLLFCLQWVIASQQNICYSWHLVLFHLGLACVIELREVFLKFVMFPDYEFRISSSTSIWQETWDCSQHQSIWKYLMWQDQVFGRVVLLSGHAALDAGVPLETCNIRLNIPKFSKLNQRSLIC